MVVDNFSRYSSVEFLREKLEACEKIEKFCKRFQNEKGVSIVKIRSDHGKEFENENFESFCNENRIKKELQRHLNKLGLLEARIVLFKTFVIQEMARVMLLNKDIPQKFWKEAMNASCHFGN